MKKYAPTLIAVIIFSISFDAKSQNKGHDIQLKINGLKDSIVFLANYYGNKQYYKDTAVVKQGGIVEFKGEEPLPGGIYSIVLEDKKTYFEFIVANQQFSLETTLPDLVGNMKVKKSEENKLFFEYLQFISGKQKQLAPLRSKLEQLREDPTANADSIKMVRDELREIDESVKSYKLEFMEKHPETFVTKVFKTSQDPDVPEAPLLSNGEKDSTFPYKYFKQHYLDLVDFSDDRLLRTPVLHNKMAYYMEKLTPQIPDSIIKAADYLVAKTNGNKETFKYVVHWVTNTYERSKIMGMDAVFVHMAEEYYLSGKAHWMDSTQTAKVRERAMALKPLLLGVKAPNLVLHDTLGTKFYNLHKTEAPYTILYLWDPDCGHCKKETPKLHEVYKESLEPQGIKVFAVSTEFENKLWPPFIKKHNLDWINVSDSPEFPSNFRDIYDVYSTPVIYVLDEDKKIIGKRLAADQVVGFLEDYERMVNRQKTRESSTKTKE